MCSILHSSFFILHLRSAGSAEGSPTATAEKPARAAAATEGAADAESRNVVACPPVVPHGCRNARERGMASVTEILGLLIFTVYLT